MEIAPVTAVHASEVTAVLPRHCLAVEVVAANCVFAKLILRVAPRHGTKIASKCARNAGLLAALPNAATAYATRKSVKLVAIAAVIVALVRANAVTASAMAA